MLNLNNFIYSAILINFIAIAIKMPKNSTKLDKKWSTKLNKIQ